MTNEFKAHLAEDDELLEILTGELESARDKLREQAASVNHVHPHLEASTEPVVRFHADDPDKTSWKHTRHGQWAKGK